MQCIIKKIEKKSARNTNVYLTYGQQPMASKKFFITKINRIHLNNDEEIDDLSSWIIDSVDEKNQMLILKNFNSLEVINLSELYWGNTKFPLLHLKKNVIVDTMHLVAGEYWIVSECFYGKNVDWPSKKPFSLRPMKLMSLYVENDTLCAKSESKKTKVIKLSNIIFCLTNPSNPLGRIPYLMTHSECPKQLAITQCPVSHVIAMFIGFMFFLEMFIVIYLDLNKNCALLLFIFSLIKSMIVLILS